MPDLRAAAEHFRGRIPYRTGDKEAFALAAACLSLMEAAPDPETLEDVTDDLFPSQEDDADQEAVRVAAWLRACATFLRGDPTKESAP